MKKITYFLLPLILLSFNSHANVIASGSEGIIERQGMKEAGKTVAKIMVVKSIWKHKKLIIGGALVVGVGGFISKEKFIDMIEHPEDHEDFMLELINDHPMKYAAFKKFLDLNIKKTNDMDYKQSLLDFESYFKIYRKDKIKDDILNSPEYKKYTNIVSDKVNSIQETYEEDNEKSICNNIFYSNLVAIPVDFPHSLGLYTNGINNINKVNRYGNFVKIPKDGITPDHIPSYKAVEKFLSRKGVINSNKRSDNLILEENLTAISIPSLYHKDGSKTFFGRNLVESSKDSFNLLKASIEDISFFSAYLERYQHQDPTKYLEASYILLKRNFYLCLYEGD